MIDWVSAKLPCLHKPLQAGMVCKINPDSSLEWATPCRTVIRGSFESSVTVKSGRDLDEYGNAEFLEFSGNPSKFLQGHNIFGSDDLIALISDTYDRVLEALSIPPLISDMKDIRGGHYSLSRIDINYSYELPSRADVLAWLRAAEFKSKTRHGRPSSKGGTLYFGKSSKRWSLKAYSKGEEIQALNHKLPDSLIDTSLPEWADNKLRIELMLRSKQLQELNLDKARAWDDTLPKQIFNDYLARLEMNEQIALTTEEMDRLPQRLLSTYVLWKDGHDLRYTLPKRTYYRHRKELLEYGINIDLRQDNLDHSNVVPLIRILEAAPAEIPEWAFSQGLIHHSAFG